MGKKLDRDEFTKSSGALREYFTDNGGNHGPYSAKVEVVSKKNGNVVLRVEPTITVAYDSMTMRIDILWEDAGYSMKEYKNLQLYGYYNCVWVPMEYSDEVLTINSPDSDKLVLVYL